MSNIGTLLKLEIKDSFLGGFSLKSTQSWMKALFQLGVFAFLFYMVYFAAQIFLAMFKVAGITYEALVLLFSLIFLYLTVTATSGTVRVLYYNGDNEILMRYPLGAYEVFISKVLFLVLRQIIMTTLIMTPVLLAYAQMESMGLAFYLRIPLVVTFLVLIPFLIANILAIPAMHLTNRIRNKFALIIVLLIIGISSLFAIYMWLFDRMVMYMKEQAYSVFDAEIVYLIETICYYLYPKYFVDVLIGEKLYMAYPSLIIGIGVGLILSTLIVNKLYMKTLIANVEVEGSAFKRKSKDKKRSVFVSLLKKEFLQIFRSTNYSFQYFVLAFSMPALVFFSNSIVQNLAKQQAGERMLFGVSLLVMLIFTTIITSFAATTVSREGECFYLTKTMPVNIRLQLFVKFTLYTIVSLAANLISVAVVILSKQMTLVNGAIAFSIVQINAFALTLLAMRSDVKRPTFKSIGESGEIQNNNVNTSRAVGLGIFVSLFFGMLGMILGVSLNVAFVLLGLSVALLGYAILKYEINLKKIYDKIND